jgi:hypothetical protein
LAKQLGYSLSYVYTLIRLLTSLPASVLQDWKAGHPLLSLPRLERLAHDVADGENKWLSMRRLHAKEEGKPLPSLEEQLACLDDEDDAAHDVTGWTPFKRPTKAAILRIRDVLARQRMPADPKEFRQLAIGLCDYVRGASSTIPFVLTPPLRKRKTSISANTGKTRIAQ